MSIINELHKRSVIKSVTFRVIVIITDFIIIFAITRSYNVAIGVLIATNVASTILYYLHERIWDKVRWGRRSE